MTTTVPRTDASPVSETVRIFNEAAEIKPHREVSVGTAPVADADGRVFTRRWGAGIAQHGFAMLPHVLFAMQARMGLNASQMIVLLHLFDHWWHDNQLPFPTRKTLANRLGVDPRHVTRVQNDLQKANFLKKLPRKGTLGEQRSNFYDLSGTIDKLKALEPEYTKMREDARESRQNVETPLSRRRVKRP